MATWVVPHEYRRKKPTVVPKDPAVLEATRIGFSNAMVDASVEDALRLGIDWLRARRPHMEIEQ